MFVQALVSDAAIQTFSVAVLSWLFPAKFFADDPVRRKGAANVAAQTSFNFLIG
ncbi:MAG: hypothetical protein PHD48_06670 [Alphaproteobacteria bacterium]|nr:hypothetical protein [Alphaproteobacteria bacterium]